jgi:hypothetical protein
VSAASPVEPIQHRFAVQKQFQAKRIPPRLGILFHNLAFSESRQKSVYRRRAQLHGAGNVTY